MGIFDFFSGDIVVFTFYLSTGIFLSLYWNFSIPLLEFFYPSTGISLSLYWNFSIPQTAEYCCNISIF